MSGKVPVMKLDEPGRASQNFKMRRKLGTMAHTQHIPLHNGSHELHNWPVDYAHS